MYISAEKHWSDHPLPFLHTLSVHLASKALPSVLSVRGAYALGLPIPLWGSRSPSLACAESCPLALILLLCVIQSVSHSTNISSTLVPGPRVDAGDMSRPGAVSW